jgi:transposase InsO family protein
MLEAVLSQIQDGQESVIAYASKSLSLAQRRYCTTYRELLAVVTFTKHFHYYLWGQKFVVRTDHGSLRWLRNFKEPEGMIARWISLLETYHMEIQYRPGSRHGNADGLSRKVPCRKCKRDDCFDCKSPVDSVAAAVQSASRETSAKGVSQKPKAKRAKGRGDCDWLDGWNQAELRELQQEDPGISLVLSKREESDRKPDKSEVPLVRDDVKSLIRDWELLEVYDGLLYRRWVADAEKSSTRLLLVAPHAIRNAILKELHNGRTAGHFGREKTLARVRQRFYWKGMTVDIERWCRECDLCARRKPGPGKGKAPMGHVDVFAPMERIAIDIMGPLPQTHGGNEYVMVVADYFTRWKEAYAIPNHTARTVADKLVTEFVSRFGAPQQIHTDQGREFESHLFREMCMLLGVEKTHTCPYRPQSDGMVERFNRTLKQMLSMYVSEHKRDWDDHIPYLMMAYRASVHESTKCTPNLLMFGRENYLPIDLMVGSPPDYRPPECYVEYVEWIRDATQQAFESAWKHSSASTARQKYNYDRKLKDRPFKRGDWVWRWYLPAANQKFGLGWTGPYLITQKYSDVTYRIQESEQSRSIVVHKDHLKPYEGSEEKVNWLENSEEGGTPVENASREDLSPICQTNEATTCVKEMDSDNEVGDGPEVGTPRRGEDSCRRTRTRIVRRPLRFSP